MIKKITDKQIEKNKIKSQNTKELHKWFLEQWDKREETDGDGNKFIKCFESGKKLFRGLYRTNTCCYSHLLPKNRFPHFSMVEENVVIVHPEWHEKMTKPKQDKLRKKLKEKYDSSLKR